MGDQRHLIGVFSPRNRRLSDICENARAGSSRPWRSPSCIDDRLPAIIAVGQRTVPSK